MRASIVPAIAIACAALWSCSDDDRRSSDGAVAAGSVGFALALPGNATVDTVNYVLTGPQGYSKMGSFSVAGSGRTFSYTLPGIPAGQRYEMGLRAVSTDDRACKGRSMQFTVIARQNVSVSVVLSCDGRGMSGSAMLDGKLNVCPVVDSASAAPSSAAVGSTIALNGSGGDEDSGPMALTYAWTSTGSIGAIADGSSQNARFTCNSAGRARITLSVGDSDTQCTGNTLSIDVTCTTAGVGGAGGGGAGGSSGGCGNATCCACDLANTTCATRLMNCENAPGTVNGVPKSELCRQVLECVRASQCATIGNGTYQAVDCFCGVGVTFDTCIQGTLSSATGVCKDIIATGAESTNVPEIGARYTDANYATGLAFQLLQCETRFCSNECQF